jgi:hypothetical protein
VPGCWGFDFQRKLEEHNLREVKRWNEAITAFVKSRERIRRAKKQP